VDRDLAAAADVLRGLHRTGEPLLLPNAWDAASARAVESAGFPVVATTSGGVSLALGYADHQQTPSAEMLAAVARIARAVSVPVTADLEAGYGLAPGDLVERMLAAGAVGLNFEDTDHDAPAPGLVDAGQQADRIAAIRDAATAAGVPVVINARIDVYLVGRGEDDEALARGRRYLDAGADCVYPIGLQDEGRIRALVEALDAPVNVMARKGAPTVERLAELGVRRVSWAGGIFRRTMAAATELIESLRPDRTS
jgi:2-methylisocitrate lyase-like PEP mutase family enzyme